MTEGLWGGHVLVVQDVCFFVFFWRLGMPQKWSLFLPTESCFMSSVVPYIISRNSEVAFFSSGETVEQQVGEIKSKTGGIGLRQFNVRVYVKCWRWSQQLRNGDAFKIAVKQKLQGKSRSCWMPLLSVPCGSSSATKKQNKKIQCLVSVEAVEVM